MKEVVPPPANPSGIVGVVGITDRGPARGARVGSWKQFLDVFGPSSAYSLPEARQLLENGAFELVVVPAVAGAARAEVHLGGTPGAPLVRMRARAAGTWANGALAVEVTNLRNPAVPADTLFDFVIRYGEIEEVFRNLQVADPDKPGYLLNAVNLGSSFAVALPPAADIGPAPADGASFTFTAADERQAFTGGVSLRWLHPGPGRVDMSDPDGTGTFALLVYDGDQLVERFESLHIGADVEPDGTMALIAALSESSYVRAQLVLALNSAAPAMKRSSFGGDVAGTEATSVAYSDAIDELAREGDVDMVLASVHGADHDLYATVYAGVAAHCANMSDEAKNRIGFGGVPAGMSVNEIVAMAALFNSERFVLVSPAHIAGAVAGRIAQLEYFQSPTFKTLAGVTALSADYLPTDLRTLLRANVLPVDLDRSLGFIIIKGITSSGEQISVTRVQDHAVRGVKGIADLFIGKLNNQLARLSLRQKLSEFFQQMEKDGAIVPSTDGTDPSFKVDVYSSQADFAQGIVRIDIAVRPVRAIDYVMATILVQA
ncbi:phage tail sheath subtilisin-like domain-containing protein [Haliangium sp.]|uniref:phage tail sheath subtilisin-like domain-containing protein n=1 Tax=Haliangium sp. TaxID=2663208 RepID=UPI003D11DB7A